MTVRELIAELQKHEADAETWVSTDCHGCFNPVDNVRRDERGMVVIESKE